MKAITILQSLQQGILICDKYGRIAYCNETYQDFIDRKLEQVKGKMISSIRKGSLVPEVLKTGIAVEDQLRKEENQYYYASVYPLLEEERIIGTVSIISTIDQKKRKNMRKTTLKERVREFERQEIRFLLTLYGNTCEAKQRVANELDISLSTLYSKLNEE